MFNALLQRIEAPVVHVGGGEGDVSERGRLEFAAVCAEEGDEGAAGIGGDGVYAVVAEFKVRECGAEGMTVGAVALVFGFKEVAATGFSCGKGGLATLEFVPFAVGRYHGALKLRNSFHHHRGGNGGGAKDLLEKGRIIFMRIEARQHVWQGQVELYRVLDGSDDLTFQISGAAVPEEFALEAQVGEAHGVARAFNAVYTGTEGSSTVGEGEFLLVAGGAAHAVVAGKNGIVEEPATQGDAFNGEWIAGRDAHGGHAGWNIQVVRSGAGLARSPGRQETASNSNGRRKR